MVPLGRPSYKYSYIVLMHAFRILIRSCEALKGNMRLYSDLPFLKKNPYLHSGVDKGGKEYNGDVLERGRQEVSRS